MLMRCFPVVLFFCLLAACHFPPPPPLTLLAVPGPTGISGQVTNREGTSAAGAAVYAYRSPKGGLRGPADFEAIVGAEGSYFLDLVEGTYHLAARLRHSGSDAGPPRTGDAWGVFAGNPVTVRQGMTSHADLLLHTVTQPMLLREGSLSSGDTGFSGRIVDAAGQPVAGAITLAYRTLDQRRMPDFTAATTGEDGRFALYLPLGGKYCLAARTRTRGQPLDGELYGVLADGEEGCRTISRGEILDIGIIVLRPYHR